MIYGHDLIQEIRRLAESQPDHVYAPPNEGAGCYYWHEATNEPGCIVGVALHRLGYEDVRELDAWYSSATTMWDEVISGPGRDWVGQVQASQDDGLSWMDSVKQADERFPNP